MYKPESFIRSRSVGLSVSVLLLSWTWAGCLPFACAASKPEAGKAVPAPRPGINLSGPADWNTEQAFVDVFRLSRRWISQRKGAAWGKGPPLDLDEHGWVKQLEPDCWAETPLCTIDGGHYPGGDYTVFYDGEGVLEAAGSARITATEAGRYTLQVVPAKGPIWLRLKETTPANPLRNIRVILPGFADTFREQVFRPDFLKRWKDMHVIRFMDWMHTNGSKVATWSDRPKTTDASWTSGGIPLEVMVDLCNRMKIAPWFCMPHLADDDYVRRFAQQVAATLSEDLPVYIEYSNEVWNGQFAQQRYAGNQGLQLGLAEKQWEAAWFFTARRSVEIFSLWEGAFGETERLVRILPSQAANVYVAQQILGFEEAWKHADALAIAPYMSLNVKADAPPSALTVASWTPDQVMVYLEGTSLPRALEHIKKNAELARRHGLLLLAYEAGQHAVGVGAAANNKAVTQVLTQANAHPRMEGLYRDYIRGWQDAGGDQMVFFSSVSKWSKWGSWGLLQYTDDPLERSPKYRAVRDWQVKAAEPLR